MLLLQRGVQCLGAKESRVVDQDLSLVILQKLLLGFPRIVLIDGPRCRDMLEITGVAAALTKLGLLVKLVVELLAV